MVSEKAREENECMGVKDEAGGRKRRTRTEKNEWTYADKKKMAEKAGAGS